MKDRQEPAPYIRFGSPALEEAEIEEVIDSLRSGWLSTGPKVAHFEEIFLDYIGAPHACAVSSCTAGLHLALIVAGIKPGDDVITSPMTFASTANVIEHVGARPVFVDIDPGTMNIDTDGISQVIAEKTKALLPVHFAGRPCDMDPVLTLAEQHGLTVIEDAAHCLEGVYKGKKVGTIGDVTVFSFYATKNLTTGEGGMITTKSEEWTEQFKVYSAHGLSRDAWKRYAEEGNTHYQVIVPGFPYNMMDLQAAIGIHQLPRLAAYLQRREEIWRTYDNAFKALPVSIPAPVAAGTVHARHLYTLLIDPDRAGMTRDEMRTRLHERGIGSGVHFISLHLHPYYANKYRFSPDDFPNARDVSERTLSLPLSAGLTDDAVLAVIEAVRNILKVG